VKGLRDEALKEVADEKNDVEKARKLFTWLKKRALVEYHALDGFSAKGIIDDKKFLCLSGAIVYTLLARDAKLNVCGVLEPGHAYASLISDRKIRIETTAEASEGFDYKREASNRVLQLGPFATYGEITDPMKFVAYQFKNTALLSLIDMALNKNEKLMKQVLKEKTKMDESNQADLISGWKTHGIAGQDNMIFWRLVSKMAEADDIFRADLIKQLDKNVEFVRTARALSPFDLVYRDTIREFIREAADLESLPAEVAEEERNQRRIKLEANLKKGSNRSMVFTSTGLKAPKGKDEGEETDASRIDAELAQLNQEAEENWEVEKKFWLKKVKRLSDAAKDFPCDEKLQNDLTRAINKVQVLGSDRRDSAVMEDLRPYGTDRQY